MDDFIFDLQRFDDDPKTTVLAEDNSIILSFGNGENDKRTIKAGSDGNVSVTVNSDDTENAFAVVSLSTARGNFFVNDADGRAWNYKLDKPGADGVIITIGSSSMAIVDSLDNGDVFLIGDTVNGISTLHSTLSKSTSGILVDGGFINDNSVSKVTLSGTALESPTDKYYKVVTVNKNDDKAAITLTADNFSTVGYQGIYAMDTSNASPSIYARLRPNDINNEYRVQSVSGSENNTLSSITVNDATVLSVGVSFTSNFAGATGTPTLIASETTLHVDSANDNFTLVKKESSKQVSLSSGAAEISLISGSVITANNKQTIKSGTYSISGYTGGSDGIIVYGNGTSATLGDIDVGESFVIANGSSTETYTKTKLGLVKNGDASLRPLVVGSTWLTDSVLPVASIVAATTKAYGGTFLDAREQITLNSSGATENPTLIAYGTTALATLVTTGAANKYSLGADNNIKNSDLNLSKWGGISLANGASIDLGRTVSSGTNAFIGDSPLIIDAGNAVFGLMEYKDSVNAVISYEAPSTARSFSGTINSKPIYSKVNVVSGVINASYTGSNFYHKGQTFELGNDVKLVRGYYPWTINSSLGGVTLTNYAIDQNEGNNTIIIGRGMFKDSMLISNAPVTVDADGNTFVKVKNSNSFTLNAGKEDSIICNPSNSSVTFVYGNASGDLGVSVTGIDDSEKVGKKFTVTRNDNVANPKKTYKIQKNSMIMSYDKDSLENENDFQLFTPNSTNNKNGVYNLAPDNFKDYIGSKDAAVTISSAKYESMTTSEPRYIISVTGSKDSLEVGDIYGFLNRTGSGTYNISISSDHNQNTLSSVFIDTTGNSNSQSVQSVNFTGNFSNTHVRFGTSNNTLANFLVLDKGTTTDPSNFTVTSSKSNNNAVVAKVGGLSGVSLVSGSILSSDSAQSITAGNYIIRSDSISDDGITVIQSISGSGNNNTVQVIGDIDYGESFYIGNTKYTRGLLGITAGEAGTGALYNVTPVGGNSDITDTTAAVAVQISQINESNITTLFGSESGIYAGDENAYVFYVGGGTSHSAPAILVDDPSKPTERYGDLKTVSGGDKKEYELVKGDNDNKWKKLDIISLTGGNITVDSDFAKNADNKNVTIMTAGGVSFLVNNTSNGVFTVNSTEKNPIIGGATELTLLDGAIKAENTQTINLGGESTKPPSLKMSNEKNIFYDKANSLGSITDLNKGCFTLNSNSYSVVSGEMNFNISGSTGDVTISNFNSDEVLKYGNDYYSIKSAGLVKGDSSKGTALWNYGEENKHSLDNNSVVVSDLTNKDNWLNILPLTNGVATISTSLPDTNSSGSAILIDSDYEKTYGTLTKANKKSFTLTKTDKEATITSVTASSGVSDITFTGKGFENVPVKSSTASFVPTAITDNNTYKVTFNKGASLSGVTAASLISGTLLADSVLGVNVLASANSSQYIQASGSAIITLTASGNKSSVALDVGESFVIDNSTSYSLGTIGLSQNNSILPKSTKTTQNIISTADIIDDSKWFNMLPLEDNAITISSGTSARTLVVDKSPIPGASYASISGANNTFVLTSIKSADSIKTVDLGSEAISLSTNFDTSIKAADNNQVIKINDGLYKANSALVIQSGIKSHNDKKSSLLSGSVLLDTTINTVRTSANTVSVGGGSITVAAGDSVILTGLNDGDIFTTGGVAYSVKGDNLLKSGQVWNKNFNSDSGFVLSSEVANGLTNDSNWDAYISLSKDSVLAVPPTGTASKWIILNNALSSSLGALSGSNDAGYSLTASSWDTVNSVSIGSNRTPPSFYFPNTFRYTNIKTEVSGAEFSVNDDNAFTVTYANNSNSNLFGSSYASITGAKKISQTGGNIALTDPSQTVTANGKEISFIKGGESNGILVMVGGTSASIGALTTSGEVDKFKVGDYNYQMLSNGNIKRSETDSDENQYWLSDNIPNNGSVDINKLTDNDNWLGAVEINDDKLTIDSYTLGSKSLAFVVNEDDPTEIYGKLSKPTDENGRFILDGETATKALSSITLGQNSKVSLTAIANKKYYLDIPITAGNTTFAAINATEGFTVDYSDGMAGTASSLSSNATGISLIGGAWNLSDITQTLTADGQVINVGESSTVTASLIDGVVDVTGLDVADEIITINNDTYQLLSSADKDSGISVSLTSSGGSTVKDISDEDNFKVNSDTFIKRSAGFVKKNNTNNYLWINSLDVKNEDGVKVASLNGTAADNWAEVEAIDDGAIIIKETSTPKVFIDSVDSLKSIYGALTKNGSNFTLSDRKGAVTANSNPNLITVEGVRAGLSGYFKDVRINAAGASFAVKTLTSTDELFIVDATRTNATLDNVAQVSLGSGTLANLSSATTVNTSDDTIAIADSSTINVGLDNGLITFSGLNDGEGFKLSDTDYVYKNVGIVRGHEKLYVDDTLGGKITSDSLTGANYQEMFVSGSGSTLTLQSQATGVFVDNAGDSVSKVYALQGYDDTTQLYTFTKKIADHKYIIDAANMADKSGISAPFEAQIITPETGTFTVNDRPYTAVTALTIDTTADSSTLNKGTAALALGASVALTASVIAAGGDSISVTGGDGIQVSATENAYTLEKLNKGDTFTIGGISYTMLSNNYLFRTVDDVTQLCTTSLTGGALSSNIISSGYNWDNYIPLENVEGKYTLNLSGSSIKDGTVISTDLNTIYADLVVKGKSFDLKESPGADAKGISQVSLGSDTSTLTADFVTDVKTTSGAGTYTVNEKSYIAKNSALDIVTDADSSSIRAGVITLNNSRDITTSSKHTVSGTVDELDVARMSFTPVSGNKFTLDGAAYELEAVGLTKTESNKSYLWTNSSTSSFVLPANDNLWSNMMTLTKTTNILDLTNGVTANSVVILDYDKTKRMALLNYTDSSNSYELTSEGGNSIATIQLGDSKDTVLSLTADFESSIKTGTGLYRINSKNYNGNGLTITAADKSSSLYEGTVNLGASTIYNSISDETNSYEVTSGDGITATATQAKITTLGDLNKDDTFKIDGNKYYKVLDSETLVQTDSDGGTPTKIYTGLITSGAVNTADIVDTNFVEFIKLGADGVLDLTKAYGASGWSGIVLGANEAGDYTLRIAQVSYDGESYNLEKTEYGDSTTLKSVSLGSAVQSFTTSIATTVNTSATNTYTVNGKPFTAQNNLKISAAANGTEATLINGAVTLEENVEVAPAQTDNIIKSTSGTMTVTADETAGTVTISGLNPGEKFKFGDVEYTMTPIGLQNGSLLNPYVVTNGNFVATTDLDLSDAEKWLTTLQATSGALTLTTSTPSNVVVVDMTSATQAVKYGTLRKSGDVYILTQDDNDAKLTSITLNGVRATLGTKTSDVDITTNEGTDNEATFSVTATDNFTVNAATNGNPSVSDVSNVSGIHLSAGTIIAPANIPVTASGYAIKATNGDMNISVVDGKAQISGLERDDTFTVDDTTNYKMVDLGLLDVTNQQLRTEVEDTYTIGDEFTRIIAVDENTTNLNLRSETRSADIYDSISAPKTQLGTLTVIKGVKNLAAVGNGATAMQSVDIAAKDNLNVTFETRVNSAAGSVTVNGNTYAGTTALAIDSDGKTSTLYAGTITLDIVTPSATDSNKNTLSREIGSFIATAADGKFTTLSGLDNAESFKYIGNTYIQNALGLINTTNNVICADILAGATINLVNLNDAAWNNFTTPIDSVLDISKLNSNYIVYDNATTPTTKYATLTVEDGKKTLKGEAIAAGVINEVVIAAGDDLTIDFIAQVDSPIGSVTVNGNTYAGTTELLIDSDGKTSTLYDGTITLDETNSTATDSSGNVLRRAGGSFTATTVEGVFTELNGLDNTESFTYGGTTYVQSAQGLRNGALIRRDLTGTKIILSDLVGTWDNILAPVDGVLDISNFNANAYIYNSATNPTIQLATLTIADGKKTLTNSNNAAGLISAVNIAAGDNLVVDFVTNINASIGTVIVNDKNYVGTTELVINSDGKTSTLTEGTVTLANNEDMVATTGGADITYTTDGGDGMTVDVTKEKSSNGLNADVSEDAADDNANSNETVTFSGLTAGDTFTIGENAYKVSAVAPMNPAGELWTGGDYSQGITLAQINDATNWTPMLAAPSVALSINAETLTDGGEVVVVDNVDEPTKIYGDLTKTGEAYALTRPTTANDELTSISVEGIAIELAPNYSGVNFTANDSAFSDVTLNDAEKTFTLDATNTPSLSENVNSLTLTAGSVEAAVNQAVKTSNNVITPTAINGEMIIGTETISGIVQGDTFTLNDKAYVMLGTGLFNDTDNKLVTSGIDDGTLTIADIVETQLIAISNGNLNLSNAAAGNSLVVDTVESPANIYGALNKNGNTYKLDKRFDGITSITLPNAISTLTTDIAATVNAPSSSNTYTVNSKVYKANNSALTIASDGTTSTLTNGTINLADNNDTVTTTSGSIVTYTTDGDGITVTAANNSVTLNGLTASDTFTVGDNAYRVSQLGFHNDANYLWTSSTDYKDGVTVAEIADAANWTRTVIADNDSLSVDDKTLSDGVTAIVIDSATAATKSLGTLSRTGDTYTLTRDATNKLSAIAVDNTKLAIDNQLADVPVTADGATFTVTANAPYTVDATGNTVAISDDATAIEISTGTITATTNQTVTATPDSGATSVIGQNNGTFYIGGETFAVADNVGSITFGMTNGTADSVRNLEENANVTIDGRTYTAPQDNSTLKFNDSDGWYFEGYVPTKYNITIDVDGNVIVDAGVKFTDVIASGQTLPEDNTIKLAVDVNTIPINVTNAGAIAIAINDKDNNPIVENLGTVENVTFDSAGVMVENTSDVAGAVFTIDTGQSFETETATITANADACAVGVGNNGTSLSVDKASTIDAPADTALTLGKARYTVNGVYFTSGGTAQASLTSDGVKFDLVTSDVITYNRTKFDGTGNATAEIDKDRGISLTSGASVDGATGKTFNIAGTVTLDANTIDAASATDVKAKASGYAVANDDVTITGDDDGYKVNISGGQISGFENIGSESGVTIGGLNNGTIKTDKVGAFTVADKTFIAVGDASVTYGIENGTLTSASDVASVITGDFSDGLTVNNGKLQVTGDNVSLDVSRNSNRKIDGFNDKATLTTADNVIKIEPTGAGEFTFGDHVFKVDDATIAFTLKNSSVIGVDSLENGNLIISQDEHNFIVNAESIDLDEINSPVTLEIADSGVHSVYGLNSGMDGLDIATVFGVSAATINNKYFEIAGGTLDAIVVDSIPASLYGLESDMTINSAPSVAIRTTENGTFTFGDDIFNINDTLDGVVVFETDENTHVINIGEFSGEAFGDLKDTALNDKPFSSSSNKVTVVSDGTDIISLQGLSSGDTISGSLSNATYVMPEGSLTVNDRGYILDGDDNGVSMKGDGLEVVGLDKDASLTVAKGGDYSVNDQDFKAKDGDTFIAGRDYVYIADPNNKPISEKTKITDIIENLLGKPEKGTVSLSGDKAASVIASGNLDSPMALTLDNSNGSGVQNADFSNSTNSKRVTLLGGDQNVKFNDEGSNAAYVDRTAKGKKNIELGNGGDVAVNDSPLAKVSIKTGKGSDTIVNRNGAKSTVDVKNNGDTTIVPTSGKVTLQNYSNDNNAKIRTFEYSDLGTAIKSNEVKFGDGVMTLGDAVIVFDPNASAVGGTFTNLVDYAGENQRVGFTHTDGGVLNASTSGDNLILKGNYAESSSDTTKTGGSTLISGRGNDTILAGGDDYIDAGAGENQIYITDKKFSGGEGVTILLAGKGKNTVHSFNGGFDGGDAIKVDDISAVKFIFDENGLVMRSGRARITFDSLEPAEELVTYSDADVAAPYEIQISDGTTEYNAAVAQEGKDIGVHDSNEANLFYGDKTGLNFSEYTGEVEVNLNNGTGSLNGAAAFFYNINKLQAGSGNSSLIGKAGAKNTLIAGMGNTSMWSAAGRDSMVGYSGEDKDGSTMFYYLAGDGRDTITNFSFMTSADGYNADIINITTDNAVTDVYLKGNNVVMQINNSPEDYLTLVDAKGKDFKINNLIAKVDDNNVEFDGIANCYVADRKNSTMSIGADVGDAQIWLDDRQTGQHGIYYLGDIKYLDAKAATGNSTLVGNDLDNIIYGGAGKNSIWGGFGDSNDTLVGGTGQNTFFFGMQNGKDIATSTKDGDVVDLTTIGLEQIRATTITGGGTKLELTDGSSLEIQGTANVEYRLNDGSRYAADHGSGQWIKK